MISAAPRAKMKYQESCSNTYLSHYRVLPVRHKTLQNTTAQGAEHVPWRVLVAVSTLCTLCSPDPSRLSLQPLFAHLSRQR